MRIQIADFADEKFKIGGIGVIGGYFDVKN